MDRYIKSAFFFIGCYGTADILLKVCHPSQEKIDEINHFTKQVNAEQQFHLQQERLRGQQQQPSK